MAPSKAARRIEDQIYEWYITLRSILCPVYNEPDKLGITNVSKRINEKKV